MTLSQAGLCYDVLGACVLGWTFFFFKPEQVVLDSVSPPGSSLNESALTERGLKALLNPERVEGTVNARADGFVGTMFLVAGFALQLVGSHWHESRDWALVLPPAGLLMIGLYGKFLRQRWKTWMWSRVMSASN